MGASTVYYTDLHTKLGEGLPLKLVRLIKKAGIGNIDFTNKFTAIKLHFGEPGNLAFLRPNYAAVVASVVKSLGGKPFLTDCNTLYVGGRKNGLDHLDSAYSNGFTPLTTGCHVLIGDGLKGLDETLVPVPNGEYVKEAKIGRAMMDADVFISLTHFKGHESTGFGGALKNIGMGCGSRGGKMEMHSAGKPFIRMKLCIGCGRCERECAHGAAVVRDNKSSIDQKLCVGCGRCISVCPVDAVRAASDEANEILSKKIAEYSAAVVAGRPQFHISLVIDVSPVCDCHSENDVPIVPNIGMFASFDPVALDQACVDAVNKQTIMLDSDLAKVEHNGEYFTDLAPKSDWVACLEHAEKLGIGTRQYELIEIK